MARITRSNIYSHSYSYSNPQSYSSPSVILPITLHNNQRRSCCLLLRGNSSTSRKLRTSDDHCYNSTRKSRFYGLYGYGDGYSIIVGHGHNHYQVTRAAKQDHIGGNYEEEGGYKREEFRWLREEERWLREEQRWLREEARWNAERDSLLREISLLKLKIQHLELELEGIRNRGDSSSTVPETLSRITALLQVLSTNAITSSSSSSNNANQNQIPEYSEENSKPLILEHTRLEVESKSENEIPIPLASVATSSKESKKKTTLRMGAEGEEVRELQEALLSLGFYSGEEDMEYSSFSSGTHRAVQTWQASIGAREDGTMTAELLEMLYASLQSHSSEEQVNANRDSTISKQDKANGVPTASVTEVREVQQTVVKKGPSDVEVPEHRVFLLGENRWEDSSRLTKKNDKQANGITSQASSTKCLVCRGEGRLLCMECDGTGEPNVEEQFLDWVEDGTKCPYCEGRGHNVCDVCQGKAVA